MKSKESANGPFDGDVVLCTQCAKEQATHEISIQCHKGSVDFINRKQVFFVSYSVCGPCARQVVEVKLATELRSVR
jgi:hypothetical protein